MIVVPIHINSSGPLDFILDTGTSRTVIDRKLAEKFQLVKVGERIMSGVEGSISSPVFETDSISMAGASVRGLRISSQHDCPGQTRGILGEDFLNHFDLLIDYGAHVIELEPIVQRQGTSEAGVLSSGTSGDRLPVELEGQFGGHTTANRLVLPVVVPELGAKPLHLLLDSGSNTFLVFNQVAKAKTSLQQQTYHAESFLGGGGTLSAGVLVLPAVSLGSQEVFHVTVIMPTQKIEVDVDGVVPASLFHSIFICHSGRFVILKPIRQRVSVTP
ncbi:retropepsin-like aspartic protease [Granulicella sibirica]|uniref:retropepsin-like aspartic protease n=1 Tax=Granulicella sibirica TaxID=2479048 RepID=UPI001375E8CD|nr:retropepsin-like aspartic protease [Granulicella sibirica]